MNLLTTIKQVFLNRRFVKTYRSRHEQYRCFRAEHENKLSYREFARMQKHRFSSYSLEEAHISA